MTTDPAKARLQHAVEAMTTDPDMTGDPGWAVVHRIYEACDPQTPDPRRPAVACATPIITITGPQGCGKARLLDTIAFDLRHRGFTVLEDIEGPIPPGEGMVVLRTEQPMVPKVDKYERIESAGALLQEFCHGASRDAGWWKHSPTGADLIDFIRAPETPASVFYAGALVAQKLCLIHSEISEAMEGHRKGLMDDKLPHRTMLEVELADAVIRIADLAGALDLDLGGAIAEKMAFNAVRPDHKPEARAAAGGKSY